VSTGFERFLRAAPWPQRAGMWVLISLARRPRGAALLARVPLAQQAGWALLSMSRYDEPTVSRALGWDAEAVVARGRALRRVEGRP
jgi:hypothetical protein